MATDVHSLDDEIDEEDLYRFERISDGTRLYGKTLASVAQGNLYAKKLTVLQGKSICIDCFRCTSIQITYLQVKCLEDKQIGCCHLLSPVMLMSISYQRHFELFGDA